ncbi:MAG TPA: AAA family ATPase [Candidatus Dietzia intestinigallinarum]|nr:AAA family ATPase [Candidatus Dietzia intestinigallinarum]
MNSVGRPGRESWGPPRVVETHGALIFLCGDEAHKVRKPLDLGFLDNRTVRARAEQSRREVELNSRLAPDVYTGVLEVRGPDDEVIEHVVRMRRLPDRDSLAAIVRSREQGPGGSRDTDVVGDGRGPGVSDADRVREAGGRSVAEGVREVARQIARLHADSPRTPEIDAAGDPDVIAGLWAESLEHLRRLSVGEDAPEIVDDMEMLATAYLRGRGPLLRSRIEAGRIVDGHGDLLAADVYLTEDGPRIIDCLEFDDRLRFGDAMLDIGFLAMDLDRSGATDLAVVVLAAYREASGDDAPPSLVHHYMGYRALVRAKVTAIRAAQAADTVPTGDAGPSGPAHADPAHAEAVAVAAAEARRALELADRAVDALLWGRVRLVLVGGVSGSGKSTLARPLAQELGAELLRSDEVRQELRAGHGTAGGYSAGAVDAVYSELLARAAGMLAHGRSVVLDATWLDPRRRAEAETVAADAHAELVEISCTAHRDELARRITERARTGSDPSEATVEVLDAQLAELAPWPDAIEVDTTALDVRDADAVVTWAARELGPLPWAHLDPAHHLRRVR